MGTLLLIIAIIVIPIVGLPFAFAKWATAPLPDPLIEYRKSGGRLARGTFSLFIAAILFVNIETIHAHPSPIVVGLGSVTGIVLLFYGFYVLIKGATSVLQHQSQANLPPHGFSGWLSFILIGGLAILVSLAAMGAALMGVFSDYVPAFSKHNWFVSKSEFPLYFWFTVVIWFAFALFGFKGTYILFRKMWPNIAAKEDAPTGGAPLS